MAGVVRSCALLSSTAALVPVAWTPGAMLEQRIAFSSQKCRHCGIRVSYGHGLEPQWVHGFTVAALTTLRGSVQPVPYRLIMGACVMKITRLICSTVGRGLCLGTALTAASVAVAAQPVAGKTPSDPPGVSVVTPPPPGYNPLAAPSPANARFALPPAPNPAVAPGAFSAWQNAVTAARNREPSTFTSTNLYNSPTSEKRSTPAPPQSR